MNLTYIEWNINFEIEEEKLNSIVIEDSNNFELFVTDLYRQVEKENEKFLITKENERIDFAKTVDVISSPIELVYNKRTIQKVLYSDLIEEANISGVTEVISELQAKIIEKISEMNFKLDYEIDYTDIIGVSDILKYMDLHLREPEGTFVEKFMEYAKNIHRFVGKKYFILVNCDAYIDSNDYQYIGKWAKYNEICVIFVRNIQKNMIISQNEYIIDNDLCILH